MSTRVTTTDDSLRQRAIARRGELVAEGVNISEWARVHGFTVSLVHNVLSGGRSCRFGKSHKIAVALGIKAEGATVDLEPRR
ncbi:hypothetical protein [Sphingomonas endophytica]|uniref:DNA-binding protein n=1 Tax=Sphingomonas endophytica TaxID=869719 RepID=A0A147I3L1_9SPHN|nr:hypothetical protein [Sphingomonas endophytica]KTT72636.1 hypothetical protein NS334_08565 [Sphingomonas endophytica]